jgi:hypothetical protein
MFLNARRVREVADYGLFEETSGAAATITITESHAFITEIERLLETKTIG